jgi:thiamine biosynthesis lipoprotein
VIVAMLLLSAATSEVRLVMGTRAEVQVAGVDDPAAALGAAFGALDLVDRSMSHWNESEQTRLNRAGEAQVSAELQAVIDHALEVAAAAEGAFDPTVEPLVRAAGGFGGPRRRLGTAERERLLARVGARHVHLDRTSGSVRLDPGTALDLGGIAKGFAVDLALRALRAAGATSGLVDLGQSSVSVFGQRLTLEVRNPERPDGPAWARFSLSEGHVSTSGGDQRKDHILDPRTGRPAHRVLSATVIAASAMEADALSTAVFVLGPERGLALLERRDAAGFVLLRRRGRPVVETTTGLRSRYALEPAPGIAVHERSRP